MISNEFNKEGILCPNCQYGIIRSYEHSVTIYEYDDGSIRCGQTMFMKCPYCGDTILCSDEGHHLTYNYVSDEYGYKQLIRTTDWIAVDL